MELTTSWKEEGIKEGILIGEKQGSVKMILRQLNRRIGSVSQRLQKRIEKLSLPQLADLSEALLDFGTTRDLIAWLDNRASPSRRH